MRIHRSRLGGHFTQIPNETLRDERLSYAARGVLCELLSRPGAWDATAGQISEGARAQGRSGRGEGRRAIRAAFAELATAGYLSRERNRDAHGRFVTEIHVYDRPYRDTGSGTSVPSAEIGHLPSSDRGTAYGPPVSGTSNRTLSTNTEYGSSGEELVGLPAGPRSKLRGHDRDIQTIIADVKAAVAAECGEREAICLGDDEALGLYASHVTVNARAGIHDLAAYMAKMIRDAGSVDGLLSNSTPVCVSCGQWEYECTCPAAA